MPKTVLQQTSPSQRKDGDGQSDSFRIRQVLYNKRLKAVVSCGFIQ